MRAVHAWWLRPALRLLRVLMSIGFPVSTEFVKRVGRAGTRIEVA
jgi:hypothetical protein